MVVSPWPDILVILQPTDPAPGYLQFLKHVLHGIIFSLLLIHLCTTNYLVELGVEPEYFGLRWLMVLFGREFLLRDLLIVWEEIFSANNNVFQNRVDMESLQKSLRFFIDEKERLRKKLEGIRFSGMVGDNDQMEVKTMVQAITCASQRKVEAHETTIKLLKDNDELCQRVKVLIEDNNKLIKLYEQAAMENNSRALENTATNQVIIMPQLRNSATEDLKKIIGIPEFQLSEMHEEKEKLMSLYENAMKEIEELKRLISAPGQKKLIEVDVVDTEMKFCNLSFERFTEEDLKSAKLKL